MHYVLFLVLSHLPRIHGDVPLLHTTGPLGLLVCQRPEESFIDLSFVLGRRSHLILHAMFPSHIIQFLYAERILAVATLLDHALVLNREKVGEI